jgi:long-chain acyl-CoA synthetase
VVMLSADAAARAAAGGRAQLIDSLSAHLRSMHARLEPHEQLDCIAVVTTPWTPENGFVTPTLKVRRARIEEAYAARYESWRSQKRPVVWAED